MKRFLVILLLFIISNNIVLCLDLRIGLSWSSTIADPFLPQETKERLLNMAKYTKIGSEVFAEWARQNDFYIGDEKLNLELVILEDDYSKESVQNNYRQLIDDGIDFLIAGFGSERSEFAAEITEERGKVLVSPSSTNESFSLNKDYAFSVFPNPVTSHAPFYPLYRLAGVNSVTFLKTPDAPRLVRREGCKGFEAELQKNLIYNFSYVEFSMLIIPIFFFIMVKYI